MHYYNGPYYGSINMKKVGEYMSRIPHVEVGLKKDKEQVFTAKEEEFINKAKKWALIICVVAVVGYAIYRLFFG